MERDWISQKSISVNLERVLKGVKMEVRKKKKLNLFSSGQSLCAGGSGSSSKRVLG